MSTITDPQAPQAGGDRAFFGHPRGLAYLALGEGFVGFSFYGMQSLLVLYMVGALLRPGHVEKILGFGAFRSLLGGLYGPLSGQPLAAAIMGLYAAMVYATPLLGGLLADRVLGRTRTVILGALLMTAGHFMMAFDQTFLAALAFLVVGSGCAGALKAQVGALYARGDGRRADAFQIYVIALNLAVIVAPLVCGTLGERVAWPLGFASAGIAMAAGLAVYLSGLRWLPKDPPRTVGPKTKEAALTRTEWRAVGVLVLLLPVLAVAALGNMEIFNAYLIWGQAHFALRLFGQVMPVSWLLSLDAFISTGCIALVLAFWRWFARWRRDPDEIVKVAIGAAISAAAPLILAAAAARAADGSKVGLVWGLGFHLVNDIGFANLYAVGLALFSRAAPEKLGATLVSAYSLHLFLANLLVARLAGLLDVLPGPVFWSLHAALVAAAALVLAVFARVFRKTLAPSGAQRPGGALRGP